MPWEQIQPKPDEGSTRGVLQLVTPDFVPAERKTVEEQPKRLPAGPLYIGARSFAHGFDLSFVLGVSFYAAKAISLAFLALYASELHAFGKDAVDAFGDTYDYAINQLFPGCAAFFSVLYFVAMPAVWGRTPGLGIFGLRIVDASGEKASVLALARRFLTCLLVYLSGGSLLISSLRGRPSRLPQDSFSATRVIKAK